MIKRVFLSAGEASGDALGEALVREMRSLSPAIVLQAVGGKALASVAVLAADSSCWGAVGIGQALRVAPLAASGMTKAKHALALDVPGLFIPIDFGFFNVRLARYAKSKGWKVLYFMPPGSWRRDKQGKDLPAIADAIVTPFPWSAEILTARGAKAHWFGHPLKQLIRERGFPPPQFATLTGPPPKAEEDRGSIAVLPGSRRHEIELNLPVLAAALPIGVPAEFAVAPGVDLNELKDKWKALAPNRDGDVFTHGDSLGVLSRARAAVVCSGTATLEAALVRCPHVVIYRVSPGTAFQARVAGFKPEFVSLPNLILQRSAIPEFVGTNIDPSALGKTLATLLQHGPEKSVQLQAFDEIDALTGPDDAISKTAELALSMLSS